MTLSTLTLAQFRRFTYQERSFRSGLNPIVGPNGSGKTTLLEAVYYLSRGRSFRTHRDRDCIQHGRSGFSLHGTLEGDEPESLGLAYDRSDSSRRKIARVNEERLSRLSDLRGLLPTVTFTPEETRLITGSPDRRRNFLNQLASQIRDGYLEHLQDYEQARNQRNQLLKRPTVDQTLLEEYDRQLVRFGVPLVETRRDHLNRLEPHLRRILADLGAPWDEVRLTYQPDVKATNLEPSLASNRSRDRNRGHTTVGPHRDDWTLRCDGRRADRFASRGERRLLAISLKFSEVHAILNAYERAPLMLLDDLESELDDRMLSACIEWCAETNLQVLMTGTDPRSSLLNGDEPRIQLDS